MIALRLSAAKRCVHIVDVILKQLPFHIGEIFGDAFHALAVQLFERRADLPLPSRGAVLGDQRVDPLLRAAAQGKLSLLLIVRADLRAEIAAAGVDNKIQRAVLGAVDLDEVVAAAERADAAPRPVERDAVRAAKLGKVDLRVERVLPAADVPAAGDLPADQRVERGKVDLPLGQAHSLHTAADVHADHARHDLVGDRHRRADSTALSGVDIRHNADPASGELLLIADRSDLLGGLLFQRRRVAQGRIVQPADLDHENLSFPMRRLCRLPLLQEYHNGSPIKRIPSVSAGNFAVGYADNL